MHNSIINISWGFILLVVVVGLIITKECPSNCKKSGPLGLGCTCHGQSGVYYTGIHIGN